MVDYAKLKSLLAEMGGVAIGYSGGVDSTLLAKAATDALGDRALCVFVESSFVPEAEVNDAVEMAQEYGFNFLRVTIDPLAAKLVERNESDRCYHCKMVVFSKIVEIAKERGLEYVLDGSNVDDESDFRPGSKTAAELKVRSPLKELGMTKEQVRAMSREVGLQTWNKPSYACLASRVPYGTPLTKDILKRVENAEDVLRELGFRQFRVRHHGDVARIELLPMEMDRIMRPAIRKHIVDSLKELGYRYIALDLSGYRTGSMNEVLETVIETED